MFHYKTKITEKLKLRAVCTLTACLFCSVSYADNNDFFSPPPVDEVIASGSMYLDSSLVEHPVLQGIFPNPSEYKSKQLQADVFTPAALPKSITERSYKVENDELIEIFPSPSEYKSKHLQADVFTPTDLPKSTTGSSYNVENDELIENFPNPSEYKPKQSQPNVFTPVKQPKFVTENSSRTGEGELTEIKTEDVPSFESLGNFAPPSEYKPVVKLSAPPQEVLSEDTNNTYVSSAEESYDFTEMEGKPVQDIRFSGLKLVNPNIVLNCINTRNGASFNAERLQKDLQQIYETGYFTDSMQVEPTLSENQTISLEFILVENPAVKDVEIIGNTVFPQNELLQFTTKLKGMPQNLYLINDSIDLINNYYNDNGYILAKVTNIDDTEDGILKLEITEGIIEKIVFEGEHKTKDYVIERNLMTKPGSVYNEEMIKKDLARIYSTQIFEKVDRKLIPSPDNKGEYIVSISIKENSSNGISIGGGIDNALGLFGSLCLWEKNFMGKGQQISLSGMIGSGQMLSDASIKNRMNYNLEFSFMEPHFINADNSLMSKLYFREFGSYNVPLAIERRLGVNTVVSHNFKGNDRLSGNMGIGYENIHLKEGDHAKISRQYAMSRLDISQRAKQLTAGNFVNFAPGIKYSVLDNEFMPRDGLVAQANFIEALGVDDMDNTNGRLIGSLTKYIPIFKKSTLLVGTKGGIKVHGDNMPEVMAFRLGGPYTIRGFRMNGVGSGDSFLMGSIELQTPLPFMDRLKYEVLKNLRFAFFVDAGKIWDPTITSKLYDRPNSAITAGVGLRVNIPGIGPIVIDYGLPLTNVGHYNKQHGYFTFGTGGLYDNY